MELILDNKLLLKKKDLTVRSQVMMKMKIELIKEEEELQVKNHIINLLSRISHSLKPIDMAVTLKRDIQEIPVMIINQYKLRMNQEEQLLIYHHRTNKEEEYRRSLAICWVEVSEIIQWASRVARNS